MATRIFDEDCVSPYINFLHTNYDHEHIPLHIVELENAQQYYTREHDDDEQPQQTREQKEWMQVCQLNQQYINSITNDACRLGSVYTLTFSASPYGSCHLDQYTETVS